MAEKSTFDFVTSDQEMRRVLQIADNIATSKATILIQGESGTGKEVLARYVHSRSPRAQRRFIAVNCAAMPDGLLESELFGFEKGAFTGAGGAKPGKFEMAHEGTFLLDEISELPLLLQAKLLRVIQEGEVERLGAKAPLKVNVRLIATTNRELSQMVKDGTFREDLFYRLNVIPLRVPSLRQRPRDIETLARLFLQGSCLLNSRAPVTLTAAALEKLKQWNWPGNVRELENVIERSVLLASGPELSAEQILISGFEPNRSGSEIAAGMTVFEAERQLIFKTLAHTNNNRTRAARLLGISIRTLRNKLHEYADEGLLPPDFVAFEEATPESEVRVG